MLPVNVRERPDRTVGQVAAAPADESVKRGWAEYAPASGSGGAAQGGREPLDGCDLVAGTGRARLDRPRLHDWPQMARLAWLRRTVPAGIAERTPAAARGRPDPQVRQAAGAYIAPH